MKCPKCDATFTDLKGHAVNTSFGRRIFKTTAFCCPRCDSVLSASIDPIALKSDTVTEITAALRPKK